MSPDLSTNKSKNEYQYRPNFWAWHPLGRGVGTGVLTVCFSKYFATGFVYGGISGLSNLALRPIYKRIDKNTETPEAKAVNFLFSKTIPWIISAGLMNYAYKNTGNGLLRMSPSMALVTAFVVELFTYANDDLLHVNQRDQDS